MKTTLISSLLLSLCGCVGYITHIEQGNFLDKTSTSGIAIGMQKPQVHYLMGQPILESHGPCETYVHTQFNTITHHFTREGMIICYQRGRVNRITRLPSIH